MKGDSFDKKMKVNSFASPKSYSTYYKAIKAIRLIIKLLELLELLKLLDLLDFQNKLYLLRFIVQPFSLVDKATAT